MKFLITGCAGFIGSHIAEHLLKLNHSIIGIDMVNDYYHISQKEDNLKILSQYPLFTFRKVNLLNYNNLLLDKPDFIIHLAAYAGVRYSIEHPDLYLQQNTQAFLHLLQQLKTFDTPPLCIFASSSSVYGLNTKVPFSESDSLDKINSPYAASKKCMEVFAQTYTQLYNLPLVGLRFFTVYGPRGRPDMAPYKFLNLILQDKPIIQYGDGTSGRDYTYIDDIVSGIQGIINRHTKNKYHNYTVFNLGNSFPITLKEFITTCLQVTGKKDHPIKQIENQIGDVPLTYADISRAKNDFGYNPQIKLQEGLTKTWKWLSQYKKK